MDLRYDMKRILLFFCVISLLFACENAASGSFGKFLSDEEGTLSILIVDYSLDNFSIEEVKSQGIEKLVTNVHQTTTLNVNSNEYGLELEKKPAYIIFTNKEKIFTTYSKDELFNFLREYKK
jgi:hypothetical protein